MNDCANAEIRDRLPDLVHGTLPPTESSAVELHLQGCADCRAEVVVIRGLRDMLVSRSRAVDVASIVSALPSRRGTSSVSRGWRSSWRVAAAVLIVGLPEPRLHDARRDSRHRIGCRGCPRPR
jgi:anti-sigma factor RsiW